MATCFFITRYCPYLTIFAALTIGIVVEFEAEPGPKGLRATKVTHVPEPR